MNLLCPEHSFAFVSSYHFFDLIDTITALLLLCANPKDIALIFLFFIPIPTYNRMYYIRRGTITPPQNKKNHREQNHDAMLVATASVALFVHQLRDSLIASSHPQRSNGGQFVREGSDSWKP